jgi:hypothetical protein
MIDEDTTFALRRQVAAQLGIVAALDAVLLALDEAGVLPSADVRGVLGAYLEHGRGQLPDELRDAWERPLRELLQLIDGRAAAAARD